ncbi:unnamed protein product, partial [Ixodes persulcatus]
LLPSITPLTPIHFQHPWYRSSSGHQPGSLVPQRADEDSKSIHLWVRSQDLCKVFSWYGVAFEVCITQHNHEVLLALVSHNTLDGLFCPRDSIVSTHTELRMCMHLLS